MASVRQQTAGIAAPKAPLPLQGAAPDQPMSTRPAAVPGDARPTPAEMPVPMPGQPAPGRNGSPAASSAAAAVAAPTILPKPAGVDPTKAAGGQAAPAADDSDAPEDPMTLMRAAPPWLVSCIFHMLLVIVLGLLAYGTRKPDDLPPELTVGEGGGVGDQPEVDVAPIQPAGGQGTAEKSATDVAATQSQAFDTKSVADSSALGPEPVADAGPMVGGGLGSLDNVKGPEIGVLLTGRDPAMKGMLLRAYGGSETTEGSVNAGLAWLARRQHHLGHWSLTGPYADPGRVQNNQVATALALIAYQGAGYTHRSGPKSDYQQVVDRGWKALIKKQAPDGSFVKGLASQDNFYTQGICTLALCELYAMTHDPEYRDHAQRAVDYLVKNQAAPGGWRYDPRYESDLSVSGWVMMALQSARMGGLNVPQSTLYQFEKFLDSVAVDEGRQYSYMPRQGPRLSMTAEGLLCREYLGWQQNDPRLVDGAQHLSDRPIDFENHHDVYYWYYATQVLHHLGGKGWEDWNKVMAVEVPKHQVRTGPEAGSWSPTSDAWGSPGGRLYTTCLSLYMLEVYYRHLPIYAQNLDLSLHRPADAKTKPAGKDSGK